MSLDDVRTSIAASSQAISEIGSLYASLTGSTASGAAIQGYEQQLAQPEASLAEVRSVIVHLLEAQAAVADLHQQERQTQADLPAASLLKLRRVQGRLALGGSGQSPVLPALLSPAPPAAASAARA